uniref:Uncharacterized protein n=1 Tax=Anopheles merus TaxID=30066 RepID=A0A182UVS5_ANOME
MMMMHKAKRQRRHQHVLELLRRQRRAAARLGQLVLIGGTAASTTTTATARKHRPRRVGTVEWWRVEQLQLLERIVTGRILGRVVDDGALHVLARRLAVPVAQVPLAVRLGREGVVADRTLVRPVAVVRAHVTHERRLVAHDVPAHVALVRARAGRRHVRPVVALEGTQVREDGGADAARELTAQLHAAKLGRERVLSLLRLVARPGRVGVHATVAAGTVLEQGCVQQAGQGRLTAPVQLAADDAPAQLGHVQDGLDVGQILAAVDHLLVLLLLLLVRVVERHVGGVVLRDQREFLAGKVDEREILEAGRNVLVVVVAAPVRIQRLVAAEHDLAVPALGRDGRMLPVEVLLQAEHAREIVPHAHRTAVALAALHHRALEQVVVDGAHLAILLRAFCPPPPLPSDEDPPPPVPTVPTPPASLSKLSRPDGYLWVRMCRCMFPLVVNVRLQYLQLNGRSPVCTSTCRSSEDADDSTFEQILQQKVADATAVAADSDSALCSLR